MVTRDQVKAEVDKIRDDYLPVIYRMILSLETPAGTDGTGGSWSEFVATSYGCLSDAPIQRAKQGEFATRDPLR